MHSPILTALWQHAEVTSDKAALIWQNEVVSYALLRRRIEEVASGLRMQSVGQGDCLGIGTKKGLDFVYLYLSGQLIVSVNVVLDPAANEKRLEYIKEMTKPKFIVEDGDALFDCLSSWNCLVDREEKADAEGQFCICPWNDVDFTKDDLI